MTREELTAMVQGCPFHRFLDLQLDSFDEAKGEVVLSLTAREEFSRDDDRVELHGGIIATLIDIAGDYAVALKTKCGVPTVNLSVDYLRLARGAKAIATARIAKCGRSIAVVTIEVCDETGATVAIGRGTYSSAVRG